jgi:DEAD/DEAH box helicase domain-containing protein
MTDPVELFLATCRPRIVSRFAIAPRAERLAPAPEPYRSGITGEFVRNEMRSDMLLRLHQKLALELIAAGKNVCLATGTASGKTAPFAIAIVHLLLTAEGTSLIHCPQKALASDLLARLRASAARAGLDPDMIGEINGDVPTADREAVFETARVIIATPDVMHSSVMRQLSVPKVRRFLAGLRYVVIDEAHALEGVFGTQCAFYLRRLRSAVASLQAGAAPPLQFIAATATIANPATHLFGLTGCKFEIVEEADNGAPHHGVTLLHVDGPVLGDPAEAMAAEYLALLADTMPPEMAFLAFNNSRQGCERIASLVNREGVVSYRSGYNPADRRTIEHALRNATLRGTVSTSALELGIDIPQFAIGLNVGVPQTRKSLRQRIGRIGRSQPGVFAVIAPPAAFAQLGCTFREYCEGEVEPSPLYLENRYIQFQHACCYREEVLYVR